MPRVFPRTIHPQGYRAVLALKSLCVVILSCFNSVPKVVIEKIAEMRVRHVFAKTDSESKKVRVAVDLLFDDTGDAKALVEKVTAAFSLIEKRMPILFRHMCSDFKGVFVSDWNNKIFVGGLNQAYWFRKHWLCFLSAKSVRSEHVEALAGIIVHESRHARQDVRDQKKPVVTAAYDLHERKREESLCERARYSFLKKAQPWEAGEEELSGVERSMTMPDVYYGKLSNTRRVYIDVKESLEEIVGHEQRHYFASWLMQYNYKKHAQLLSKMEIRAAGFVSGGVVLGSRITGTFDWPSLGVDDGSCFCVEMTVHNKTKKPIKIIKCSWYSLSWCGEWEEVLTPRHLGFGQGELQGLGTVIRPGLKVFPYGSVALPRYFVRNGAKWVFVGVDDECNVYVSECLLDLDATGPAWPGEAWIPPSSAAGGLDVTSTPLSLDEMLRMPNARRVAGLLSKYYACNFFRGYKIAVKNEASEAVRIALFQNTRPLLSPVTISKNQSRQLMGARDFGEWFDSDRNGWLPAKETAECDFVWEGRRADDDWWFDGWTFAGVRKGGEVSTGSTSLDKVSTVAIKDLEWKS